MKKELKLNTIILVFSIFLVSQAVAADRILPVSKPTVDQETKKRVDKKKEIYPQKKPTVETEEIPKDEIKTVTESIEEIKESINIYPQKKPIIVHKKIDKAVAKSKLLSKSDFKIAKAAFEAVDKRKWKTAIKTSKRAKDKMIFKTIYWLYLIERNNDATFLDYLTFINNNPYYPRINRLKYLAEYKIYLKTVSPKVVLKWFDGKEPLSEYGKIKLGEIYISMGDIERGSKLIKEGWIKARLSKNDLKYLRKKYRKIITVSDNIKRADWHAWEGKHWDVQRMLRYLPKDETALYRARQLLMSRSYGVDNAIAKVPAKFKNDIGLKYDRLKWRRRRGRLEPSLEILFTLPNNPLKLVRPDIWWKERAILARSLIYKKNIQKHIKLQVIIL